MNAYPGYILLHPHASSKFLPIIPSASWRVYYTSALWLQSSKVETWPHQWPQLTAWPWRPLLRSSLRTHTYTFTPSSSSSSSVSCVSCSWWRSSMLSASTAHFSRLLKMADKTPDSVWTERTPPSDAVPPVTRQGISSDTCDPTSGQVTWVQKGNKHTATK